jgi:hypothetical protein
LPGSRKGFADPEDPQVQRQAVRRLQPFSAVPVFGWPARRASAARDDGMTVATRSPIHHIVASATNWADTLPNRVAQLPVTILHGTGFERSTRPKKRPATAFPRRFCSYVAHFMQQSAG